MTSHRCTVLPRALAATLVLVSLLVFVSPASADAPTPEPEFRTPSAAIPYEPGDLPRLPALFPQLPRRPDPAGGSALGSYNPKHPCPGDGRPRGGKMWRTDTIMIAAIDAPRREVGILSIPRDLWVDIPGYGKGRINIVDFVGESRSGAGGGPALVNQVLEENFGLQTQHWVRIRQEGLVDLVNAMDGITITLDCPFVEKTPDPKVKGQYEYLMLPAGSVFLEGETAKKFVTYRYSVDGFQPGEAAAADHLGHSRPGVGVGSRPEGSAVVDCARRHLPDRPASRRHREPRNIGPRPGAPAGAWVGSIAQVAEVRVDRRQRGAGHQRCRGRAC